MRGVFTKSIVGLAALSAAAIASPAYAAQFVFPLTGSSSTNGTHANSQTYSITQGTETINLRVTGWSLTTAGQIFDSYLGLYSNGAGVTSGDENGGSLTHTIDNQNRYDFVLFQFDRPVELVSGKFTVYNVGGVYDSDVTVASGMTGSPWNSQPGLDGQNFSSLSSLLNNGFSTVNGGSSSGTKMLNPGGNVGNIWLIGAAFNNPDSKIDSFKLSKVVVNTAVPEPATWMMMIVGFGFVGAMLRRRSRPVAPVSA
jgi:PEP-CTERM motif